MKISNGSTGEFVIAIFLVIGGLSSIGTLFSYVSILCGILIIGHCIYLWSQIRKKNTENKLSTSMQNTNINQPIENNTQQDNQKKQQAYQMLGEMQQRARKDLETCVSRKQLKDMLEKNIITKEQYDKYIDNIESLEMLAYYDYKKIFNNDQKQ